MTCEPQATIGAGRLDEYGRLHFEDDMTNSERLRRLGPTAFDVALAVCGAGLLSRQFIHAISTPGIDFVHVWHAGRQLLSTGSAYRDPLFTYPPGAALILAPLGFLDYNSARLVMLVANVIAVVWATWMALKLLQGRPTRRAVAVSLLALGVADAVASTWANDNLNGLLLLAEMAALSCMRRGRWSRAGVLLGVSLAIKPVLVALLVMLAIRRKWRALMVTVSVPVAITGVGWYVVRDSSRYAHVVVPFLVRGAQLNYNDSFVGAGHLLSLPAAAVVALRLCVLVAVGWWYLRRRRGHVDVSITSFCYEAGILLTATFLAAPMSETYYTIYLLPAIAAWASRSVRSAVGATVTVAAFFASFELRGGVGAHVPVSVPLAVRPTLGWIGCLAVFAVIANRLARPEGRTLSAAHINR